MLQIHAKPKAKDCILKTNRQDRRKSAKKQKPVLVDETQKVVTTVQETQQVEEQAHLDASQELFDDYGDELQTEPPVSEDHNGRQAEAR